MFITKFVEFITKENTKLPQTDPRVNRLKSLQGDLEFLNVTHIISTIIKLKTILWFRYKWKTMLVWILLGIGGYYVGDFILKEVEKRTVYIRIKTKVAEQKDSTICIDDIINKDVKKYFSYIASTESQTYADYNTSSDAWGRYQFVPIAREMIKNLGCTFTKDFFMNNPEFQDVMMYIMLKEHHKYFKVTGTYDKYVGKIINGYYISQCGLLSMSHACGVGGTIEFLEAGCNPNVLPSGAPEADKRLTIQKYILVFDKDTNKKTSK